MYLGGLDLRSAALHVLKADSQTAGKGMSFVCFETRCRE